MGSERVIYAWHPLGSIGGTWTSLVCFVIELLSLRLPVVVFMSRIHLAIHIVLLIFLVQGVIVVLLGTCILVLGVFERFAVTSSATVGSHRLVEPLAAQNRGLLTLALDLGRGDALTGVIPSSLERSGWSTLCISIRLLIRLLWCIYLETVNRQPWLGDFDRYLSSFDAFLDFVFLLFQSFGQNGVPGHRLLRQELFLLLGQSWNSNSIRFLEACYQGGIVNLLVFGLLLARDTVDVVGQVCLRLISRVDISFAIGVEGWLAKVSRES